MTSWPCSASSAAATDESTPPDIATTMRICLLCSSSCPSSSSCLRGCLFAQLAAHGDALLGEPAKLLNEPRQHLNHAIDFRLRREGAEAEAERVLRAVRWQSHGTHD